MASHLRHHIFCLPTALLIVTLCCGLAVGQDGIAAASTTTSSTTVSPYNSTTLKDTGVSPTGDTVHPAPGGNPAPGGLVHETGSTPTTTLGTTKMTSTTKVTSSTEPPVAAVQPQESTSLMSTPTSTKMTTASTTASTEVTTTTAPSTARISTTTTVPSTSTKSTTTTAPSTPRESTTTTAPSTSTQSTTTTAPSTSTKSTTTTAPSTSTKSTTTTAPSTSTETTTTTSASTLTERTTAASTTPSNPVPVETSTMKTKSTTVESTSAAGPKILPTKTMPISTKAQTAVPTAAISESTAAVARNDTPSGVVKVDGSSTMKQTDPTKPMSVDTTQSIMQMRTAPMVVSTTGSIVGVKNNTDNVARTSRPPAFRLTSAPPPVVVTVATVPVVRTTNAGLGTDAPLRTTQSQVFPPIQTAKVFASTTARDGQALTTGKATQMFTTTPMYGKQTSARPSPARLTPPRIMTTGRLLTTSTYDRGQTARTSMRVQVTTGVRQPTSARRTTTRPTTSTTRATTEQLLTVPPTDMPSDVTYKIRFDGDCSTVLSDTAIREKFEANLKTLIEKELLVPKDNILFHDISCGSVDVIVTLIGVHKAKVDESLNRLIAKAVPLIVTTDDNILLYRPINYTTTDPSGAQRPKADAVSPTVAPSGLRSVDMIIIIVVSIIGGLLIIIIIVLIVHECRRRSHTKSFDLRGTPRPHLNTEDFTLTKMERGPVEYNDYGMIVNSTSNGHTRAPQVGVATIVESPSYNGGVTHNGYHNAGHKEGYEPDAQDVGPDSPSISLMKSMRTPDVEGGIENPSFSSEDMLDSGTETDREMVSSDKGLDSPDHVVTSISLQMDPVATAESDSGRQSDSPTDITPDTPPQQYSPRSDLSDNTESELHFQPPTIPFEHMPYSPLSESEVLMSQEEMSYPANEAEDSDLPQSTGSPDVLSHSPQQGLYEMTETRNPGNRASDFFAPAEGATAF